RHVRQPGPHPAERRQLARRRRLQRRPRLLHRHLLHHDATRPGHAADLSTLTTSRRRGHDKHRVRDDSSVESFFSSFLKSLISLAKIGKVEAVFCWKESLCEM